MTSFSEALKRIGGMHGSAWRGGTQLAEVVEVSGAIEVNRIEVPLVGQTKQGYKPGRESREGTLRVQLVDSRWQLEIYRFLNAGLETRRAARNAGESLLRPFTLKIAHDDPDAYGYMAWQLNGCLIWRMQLGFSITDDIQDLEFPLTWESETPLSTFVVDEAGNVTKDPHKDPKFDPFPKD